MVLEEDDLRLITIGFLVLLDPVIHLLEKGITGIGILDIEGFGEKVSALGGCIHRAHEAVYESRMEMDDESIVDAVMHGGLH